MERKDYTIIITLTILALLPGAIFYYMGKIELNEAKFAEQWSKTIITSLVLVYVVKYLDYRALKNLENQLKNDLAGIIEANKIIIEKADNYEVIFKVLRILFVELKEKNISPKSMELLKEIESNSHLASGKEFKKLKKQILNQLKNLKDEIKKQS